MIRYRNRNIDLAWQLTLVGMLFFVVTSCKKNSPFDCFKSTGPDVTEIRSVSDFNKISLSDNVNLVLTQDIVNSIKVKAGEHIIDNIETSIEDHELHIANYNTCNWMRSFKREIIVYVGVKNLNEIEYRGSGDITSTNTITGDSLKLQIWDGAGKIDMNVDVRKNTIYFHIGTADVFYQGFAHLSYVSSASFGLIDARELNTTFTYIGSTGSNNCFVNSNFVLEATISSIGNIYYFGDPEIKLTGGGTGQLIKYSE